MKLSNNFPDKFNEAIIDEDKRSYFQSAVIYVLLAVVATVLGIINIATIGIGNILTIATLAFAGLCILNFCMLLLKGIPYRISTLLFPIGIVTLFGIFLLTGIPEGFSAIWIAMLPSFGLLQFKLRWGSIFSGVVFILLIFFLWTPWGNACLQHPEVYTDTFKWRFPILYLTFFGIAFFLELIRELTYDALVKTRKEYEYLSKHDPLTKTLNRFGFKERIDENMNLDNYDCGFAMLDIDDFKKINDTYGHLSGDIVIRDIVNIINEYSKDFVFDICRWGGEEFIIVIKGADVAKELCENIVKAISEHESDLNGSKVRVTISVGLVLAKNEPNLAYNKIIKQSDDLLYQAKREGKNRVIVAEYEK